MTPADMLVAAENLIARPDAKSAGLWSRAAALLARQALESVIARFWLTRADTAGLISASMRSQLACLPFYLDRMEAERAAYTWAALSNACHYHSYELAPTAPELIGWIESVRALMTYIEDHDSGVRSERQR